MSSLINLAKKVISIEIEGLRSMSKRIDTQFVNSVESIVSSKGRVIVCGMGKSGIIGRKLAASLASTGTPSFFMHPGEAFHGDLGMVKPEDIFVAISNSGETEEVIKLLPFLKDNDNIIIAMTGNSSSTLAVNALFHLDVGVPEEACKLQLAPTSSTTATLVMGDALTVALMEKRDFKPESFARFHPGGSLGRRLLSSVRDEMITTDIPTVNLDCNLPDIIHSISHGNLGLTLVEVENSLPGIITDGDLRRAIDKFGKEAFDLVAGDIVIHNPKTVSPTTKIQTAYDKMDEYGITSLLVCDDGKLIGVLKK